MRGEQLSNKQIKKGIIILAVFVVLRAIVAKIGGVDQGVQVSSQSILFLTSTFLILSVGLVYLGFTKWIGIDLKQWWWFDRKRILGDVGWGMLAQQRMELINKIDAYIKDKFKVYHLYAPDFASDVVREERDRRRTLIQKTRDEIAGLQDAIFLLSMPLKTVVYGYLKMNQRLAESLKEFERRVENKKFKSSILNKIFEVWIYKRAYKVNEIKKIASENQKAKILYIGIKGDFSYLPLENSAGV